MELIKKIQYVLDHPNQIDWHKIHEIFDELIKNDVEIGDSEIQHIKKNLRFNQNVNTDEQYAVMDKLFLNYTFTRANKDEIPRFESENPALVECLNDLMFKSFLSPTLSYPADYQVIMTQFEKLVLRGVQYNIDEVRNWLELKRGETMLMPSAIDIVQLADFIQMYHETHGMWPRPPVG